MRRSILLTALFLASVPLSASNAQSVTIHGVNVKLGAPQEHVLWEFRSGVGMSLMSECDEAATECNSWMIMRGDRQPYDGIAGSVTFRDGVVVQASRIWEPYGEASQASAVRSVIGALRSLLGTKQAANCMVTDVSREAPAFTMSEIDVNCGDRSVSLTVHRYEGDEGFTITEYVEDEEALRQGGGDSGSE